MPKLFKFVPNGDSFTMFEEHGDELRLEPLRLNQQISQDPDTGIITLVTRKATFIEIETFFRTPDTGDDESFYFRDEDRFTDLDGNPIPEPVYHFSDDGIDDDQDDDGSYDDRLDGTSGRDERHGGGGDDDVYGYAGDDSLHGEEGDDYLSGGHGNDHMRGDDGYDILHGGKGKDDMNCGDGDDIANGGYGWDTIRGGGGDDQLIGQRGRDTMNGGSGRDDMRGGAHDDRMNGGSGDDRVDGGSGDDKLRGGAGTDTLIGGEGSDRFIYDDGEFGGVTNATADRIADFSHEQGDLIDLSRVDANTTLDGDQAFTFIGSAAFSGTAGELRFEAGDQFSFVYGDQNGDGEADFALRFDDSAVVTESDFIL